MGWSLWGRCNLIGQVLKRKAEQSQARDGEARGQGRWGHGPAKQIEEETGQRTSRQGKAGQAGDRAVPEGVRQNERESTS